MREIEIREKLDRSLRRRYRNRPQTVIRHETGICAGRRRIDVAVISHELSGYEIKGPSDSLLRLAGQAEAYGRVFDRMTLVSAEKHLEQATAGKASGWKQ
jgi:hypothetical protein